MQPRFIKNKEIFQEDNEALRCGLPYSDDVSILAEPLQVGGKTVPNRLVCQAMEGCDGTAAGEPGELTVRRYERLAGGGAGLIWVEATAVLEQARANPRQLWLREETLDGFRALAEHIRQTAAAAGRPEPALILQLTHSGRYSRPNGVPAPLIAYQNPLFDRVQPVPDGRVLSDDELDAAGEALVKAARLAQKAGFDGADIKCCHRYLLSETLSAYRREGRYGGSLENRSRLLLDSVRGAMQVCGPGFLVTTRLNIYDGFPYPYGFGVSPAGGLEPDYTEPAALVKTLAGTGMPLIDLSMGNPYVNPHVNRPYLKGGYDPGEHPLSAVARMLDGAARMQREAPEMHAICSGLSFLAAASPHVAAACIREGRFRLAGFGRMTLAYPDFARDILESGGLFPEKCCVTCGKCTELMRAGSTPGCVMRDRDVYLPLYLKFCRKENG